MAVKGRLPFRVEPTGRFFKIWIAGFGMVPLVVSGGFALSLYFYGEWPIGVGRLLPVTIAGCGVAIVFILPFAALWGFSRDPERRPPRLDDAVVAPADGRLVCISREDGVCRFDIYLSLLDVHVQRLPCRSKVVELVRHAGRTVDARRAEASKINKRVETRLETGFGPVSVAQVAGKFASRVINVLEPGDEADAGTSFGMITLGSRVVLELPPTVEVVVQVGDRVRAGETVVARASVLKPETSGEVSGESARGDDSRTDGSGGP